MQLNQLISPHLILILLTKTLTLISASFMSDIFARIDTWALESSAIFINYLKLRATQVLLLIQDIALPDSILSNQLSFTSHPSIIVWQPPHKGIPLQILKHNALHPHLSLAPRHPVPHLKLPNLFLKLLREHFCEEHARVIGRYWGVPLPVLRGSRCATQSRSQRGSRGILIIGKYKLFKVIKKCLHFYFLII